MDITTCIQYLNFVANECDRILRDGNVADEELNDLIIEFRGFQEKVRASNLDDGVKSKVAGIQFSYSITSVNRNQWIVLAALMTFGSWWLIMNYRQQQKRKEAIKLLRFDVSRLAGELEWNLDK
jgi:hypothetical protein